MLYMNVHHRVRMSQINVLLFKCDSLVNTDYGRIVQQVQSLDTEGVNAGLYPFKWSLSFYSVNITRHFVNMRLCKCNLWCCSLDCPINYTGACLMIHMICVQQAGAQTVF